MSKQTKKPMSKQSAPTHKVKYTTLEAEKFSFNEIQLKKPGSLRLWNVNYFYNRNLIVALSQFLQRNPEYNIKNSSSHILTSSIASSVNVNAPIDYCASKAALESLIKNLSTKIAPSQRINLLKPGHIFTEDGIWGEKSRSNPENVKKIINSQIPLLRLGSFEDISSLILFLLNPNSGYLTGNCFTIDGGLTAAR